MVRAVDRRRRRNRRRGFTLIETALATIIVGVGVLAMITAQTSFLKQNVWSSRVSTAERLGNEIREMTLNLPRHDPVTGTAEWGPEDGEASVVDYDDLDDFDGLGTGTVFSAANGNGPLDAQRRVISNMTGWGQVVEVFNVLDTDIAVAAGSVVDASTEYVLVRVTVTYQGSSDPDPETMTSVQWIASR